MFRISKENKHAVFTQIRLGHIDAVSFSTSRLVDDVIRTMKQKMVLGCILKGFEDKRADNTVVPFAIAMALAIAAKITIHTSLTEIPLAITDHRTICELGYSMVDMDGLGKGLMTEGTIRHIIGKYSLKELITSYNKTVQVYIMPRQSIKSNIHILDCTKLRVNIKNTNYEGVGDSGNVEEITFGPINRNELPLSWDMLLNTPVLEARNILINDRGFFSWENRSLCC